MCRAVAAVAMGLLLMASAVRGEELGTDSSLSFPPIGCGGPEGLTLGCHLQVENPQLVVSLEGDTQIDAGGAGVYTVSIPSNTAGCGDLGELPCVGAGLNVRIADAPTAACDLDLFGAQNLRFIDSLDLPGGRIVAHRDAAANPPTGNKGVFSYQFLLINCSGPGQLTLLAAMNAYDGSGIEIGEIWNQAQLAVTVPEAGATGAAAGAVVALAALARRCERRA